MSIYCLHLVLETLQIQIKLIKLNWLNLRKLPEKSTADRLEINATDLWLYNEVSDHETKVQCRLCNTVFELQIWGEKYTLYMGNTN